MARFHSRRKTLVAREPSGRPSRAHADPRLLSPTETRRMFDAAAAGLRDQVWGTMAGRLYTNGTLTSTEFAAAKRWAELVATYHKACRSPQEPRTLSFDNIGSQPTDPDTVSGEEEVARHRRTAADWRDCNVVLRQVGGGVERAVEAICIKDLAPTGLEQLNDLKRGLQLLSAWWTGKRKGSRA